MLVQALIFILALSGVTSEGKFQITDVYHCNPYTEVVVNIVLHYFRDVHEITLIDLSPEPTVNVFKCMNGNIFRPANVFDDLNLIKLGVKTDESSVSAYSTTHGYFIKCSVQQIRSILKLISSYNPRAKLMIQISPDAEGSSKTTLQEAYHDFKMLDVTIWTIQNQLDNGKLIAIEIFLHFYNPFSGSENVRRPEFVSFEFTLKNVDEINAKIDKFIDARTRNLQRFPIRIDIFDFPMTSKAEYDRNGRLSHFSYVDGQVIECISKILNFTPIYIISPDNNKYGYQLLNGTFTGSLGAIEYDKADLVANPRLIANYNTTKALFLQPITMVRLFFIIHKRPTFKVLMISMFNQYDNASKIMSIVLIVLFPLIYLLINRFELRVFNDRMNSDSIDKTILYFIALQNNISMRHSPHTSSRIVTMTILFYALITSALFQSTIIKNLNTNQRFGSIRTISELIDEGCYKIGMPPYISLIFKEKGLDKVSRAMTRSNQSYISVAIPAENGIGRLKTDTKLAYLWTDLYIGNFLNQFYDPETGENLMDAVPDVAFEFYISYMVPKNSPFIERFNEIFMRYVQTGLGAYEVGKAYADNDKIWIQRIKNGQIPRKDSKEIKLNDLSSAFEIYMYLCVSSMVVFMLELVINIMKKWLRKNQI